MKFGSIFKPRTKRSEKENLLTETCDREALTAAMEAVREDVNA